MEAIDSFGEWVKTRRLTLRLSRDDLAQRVGCALITLRKIESDERRPSVQIAERLAAHLEIPGEMRRDFVRAARAELSVSRLLVPDQLGAVPARSRQPLNLPFQRSRIIGRERDAAAVRQRLLDPNVGLVTLTGPPGVGKTRLSLHVAANLGESFPDGIVFVGLAPISDPSLVMPAIAQALGVKERGSQPVDQLIGAGEHTNQPLLASLKGFCSRRVLLLLLDNFEQVLAAAPALNELLAAAPNLKLLVTSRAALHISGEHEFAVQPLALPNLAALPNPSALVQVAAVDLFIQRAQAAQADFSLTAEHAATVAEICYRLDGLPLAIELAAARIKVLPPPDLLARLASRLNVLTDGMRDVPARHQTLRNAIAWSYELLNPDEQRLFRRLAAFVGGCQLAAIEAVCADLPFPALDVLASLLDKSLIRQRRTGDSEPRFELLETIREYAVEQLAVHDEAQTVRQRHAEHYLRFVEATEPLLQGADQVAALDRLDTEHGNLRAALEWSLDHADPGYAMRFGAALWLFWQVRGHISEGRAWLAAIIDRSVGLAAVERARVLNGAGMLAWSQSDVEAATDLCDASLDLARQLGDRAEIAHALNNIATIMIGRCDFAGTLVTHQESLAISRELGLSWMSAWSLTTSGFALYELHETERAQAALEEALALFRAIGGLRGSAFALLFLAHLAQAACDFDLTEQYAAEGLAICRELRDPHAIAHLNEQLAFVARARGELDQAAALLEEGIDLLGEQGDVWRIAWHQVSLCQVAIDQGQDRLAMELLEQARPLAEHYDDPELLALCFTREAALALRQERPEAAIEALAAAEASLERYAMDLRGIDSQVYRDLVAAVRAQTDAPTLSKHWERGRSLINDQKH